MADEPIPAAHVHEHEHTDMNIAAILWFFAGLVISAILIHLVIAGLYQYFMAHNDAGKPVSPFAPPRQLPPYPRLQVSPREELRDYLLREDRVLTSYGWEDKSKGVVHIPIDRAIDLISQRGMPATPPPAAAPGTIRNPAGTIRGNPGAMTPATPGMSGNPAGGAQ